MPQTEQDILQELEIIPPEDSLRASRERLEAAVAATKRTGHDVTSIDRHMGGRMWDITIAANTGGVLSVASDFTDLPFINKPEMLPLAMIVAVGGVTRQVISNYNIRKSPTETPLQSKITVLQARSPYRSIADNEIVLDFQPGLVPAETKSSELIHARHMQLIELRDISADVDYDHVILPLSHIGGGSRSRGKDIQLRKDAVRVLTGCNLLEPDQTEIAVWTKQEFETRVSAIETIRNKSTLQAIIGELVKKVPNPYAEAYLENSAVLEVATPYINRYLRSVLLKGLTDELEVAKRINDGVVTTKQHLTNRLVEVNGLIKVNQYDENQNLVSQENIERIASINEPVGDIDFWNKLTTGQYNAVQLSYLAIQLLKESQAQEDDLPESATDPVTAPEFTLPNAKYTGDLVNTEVMRQERRQTLRRRIGTVLMVLAIAKGGDILADKIPDARANYDSTEALQPVIESMDSRQIGEARGPKRSEWQLVDNGIQTSGYYQLRTYDTFNGKEGWTTSRDVRLMAILPYSRVSGDVPHLTIKDILSGNQLKAGQWLPVREGTTLSAIRVIAAGDSQNVHTIEGVPILTDGTGYMVQLPSASEAEYYYVEADFTSATSPQSNNPLNSIITRVDSDEAQRLGYIQAITQISVNRFRYDNTKALNGITRHAHDSSSLISGIEKAGICNCNLCASRVALLARAKSIPAEYAAGYINSGGGVVSDNDSNYLNSGERHGWVEYAGVRFDPTPNTLSYAESEARLKAEEAQYEYGSEDKGPDKRLLMLGLLPLLAYGGLKSTQKFLTQARQRREQRWLDSDTTRQSYDYLNWVMYGNPNNPPSAFNNHPSKSAEEMQSSLRGDFNPRDLSNYLANQPWRFDNAAKLSYRQTFQARRLARKIIRNAI